MKKVLHYFVNWLVTTIALFISWSIGGVLASRIAAMPAAEADPATQASRFLLVCIINAALITSLTIATGKYKGLYRWLFLVLFVFGIQFLLTQMETLLFAGVIGITTAQVMAILTSGFIMSLLTVTASLGVERLYLKKQERSQFSPELPPKKYIGPAVLLALLVYPLLYMVFGYFVAWQNPEVRIFYTGTDEIRSFLSQLTTSFLADGIYPYQVIRSLIWMLLSFPVLTMMRDRRGNLFHFALATALLPATLLFLPNAFMPPGVALTHFYETASSNFIWGFAMGWGLRV
jgi:hypothetical protein